ncbi:PIN domain-containing protein [Halobaculum sp. CBA1158]|uniref:PIN domain-containing protein n=1 Tax=Halobaculum sp. CBA1158 TaxID=2904243 RepID=UPI001F38F15C|nr:PIN domain-containing protein [Halobaculum sp. CBA1158]UIP00279.1 PIN domain-containing protein [Halobaculum sp. CBA1158]
MILDTCFLADLRDNDEVAAEKAAELEATGLPLRVPSIVVWELYFGVGAGSETVTNQREYERLIANKPVVSLGGQLARRAGVLMGTHRVSDTKPTLDPGDSIVAATGLKYNEPVVTTDRDFDSVDGLRIESY